ncbi:MAG: hypothetical protein WCF17_20940 [Terracidiphilus sp.]
MAPIPPFTFPESRLFGHVAQALSQVSAFAETAGQRCETRWSAGTLIWRGVQRFSTIFQLGFFLFGEVSPARDDGLARSGGRLEFI